MKNILIYLPSPLHLYCQGNIPSGQNRQKNQSEGVRFFRRFCPLGSELIMFHVYNIFLYKPKLYKHTQTKKSRKIKHKV